MEREGRWEYVKYEYLTDKMDDPVEFIVEEESEEDFQENFDRNGFRENENTGELSSDNNIVSLQHRLQVQLLTYRQHLLDISLWTNLT